MKNLILFLIGLLVSLPVMASDAPPVLYSRTHIAIVRKNPPALPPLPWQKEVTATENPTLIFDVEVRDSFGALSPGRLVST